MIEQNCAGGLHELDCGIEIVPAGVFWKVCWHVFDCAGSNWSQRFQRKIKTKEEYNCESFESESLLENLF